MAHLRNYKIIERWKVRGSDTRYHITDNGFILRTTGPRLGGAKFVRYANDKRVPVSDAWREHRLNNGIADREHI